MNDYSKEDLQEMAKPYFKAENVSTLYATSDGQIFVLEGFQKNHAGQKLACYTLKESDSVKKEIVKPAATEQPLSIPKLIEHIATITSKEDLMLMITTEVGGTNRVGAVAALNARIHELDFTAYLSGKTEVAELEELKATAETEKRKADVKMLEVRIAELSK